VGALRGDDDGRRSPDEIPDLPPDWGHIVVPDDASALAEEAEQVRRELRQLARRRRWQRRLRLTSNSGLVLPLLIVATATVISLISLFAVAWPRHPDQPDSSPTIEQVAASPAPDLILRDDTGADVPLREARSVVVLVVGECSCTALISETIELAADEGVGVLVVGALAAPSLPPDAGPDVMALSDPSGALLTEVGQSNAPPSTAAVMLIDADGNVVRVLAGARTAAEFSSDLVRLG